MGLVPSDLDMVYLQAYVNTIMYDWAP